MYETTKKQPKKLEKNIGIPFPMLKKIPPIQQPAFCGKNGN